MQLCGKGALATQPGIPPTRGFSGAMGAARAWAYAEGEASDHRQWALRAPAQHRGELLMQGQGWQDLGEIQSSLSIIYTLHYIYIIYTLHWLLLGAATCKPNPEASAAVVQSWQCKKCTWDACFVTHRFYSAFAGADAPPWRVSPLR